MFQNKSKKSSQFSKKRRSIAKITETLAFTAFHESLYEIIIDTKHNETVCRKASWRKTLRLQARSTVDELFIMRQISE